jgi:hypothetical protein
VSKSVPNIRRFQFAVYKILYLSQYAKNCDKVASPEHFNVAGSRQNVMQAVNGLKSESELSTSLGLTGLERRTVFTPQ